MLTSSLKKVCQLTILAIILVVPVLYPLKLDDALVTNLAKKFHSLNLFQFYQDNIEPIIFYTYSPLVLKETIAEAFIVFLFITYLFYLFFKSDRNENTNSFLRQNLPLILFVIFAGISVFYSPTFYYSLRSWFHIVCFSLFFLLVRELADSPVFLRKIIITILAVSGLLTLVAILQHLNLATWLLPKFDEPRNRMGSFIGHNTGLSMFLLPSFFLCLSLLISGTRKLVKVLILVLLILEIFVLLAAQSRGTWLVLIITLPLFFLSARSYLNFKLTKRQILIALLIILVIVLSQNLPSPLYSREISFAQRLQHFSPSRLLTETRLRILVCSFPLIKEKPLWGHGIGSFQYVYPKVQGEYFVRNPHSILWPTGRRSQHAHNDYLQLLIELGLVGGLLLLSALYLYLRYGWNTFLQNKDISTRAIQLALFFSLTGILLQAFVDFPFHISPVGVYLIFILALWSANPNLFLTQTMKKENITSFYHGSPVSVFSSYRVLYLIPIMVCLFSTPFIMRFIMINYSSSLLNQRANSYTKTFYLSLDAPLQKQQTLLREAKFAIKRALRLEPLAGENLFKAAEINYLYGMLAANLARQIPEDTEANRRARLFYQARAKSYYEESLFYVQSALAELRIHSNYYLMGLIYRDLAELARDTGHPEQSQNFFNLAKENFFTAVKYTMAYGPAVHELAELLLKENPPNYKLINELRRQIARYDPEYFHENYFKKLADAIVNGEYERGLQIAKALVEIDPDNVDFHTHLFYSYLRVNDLAGAEQQLKIIQQLAPDNPQLPSHYTIFYIHQQNWQEAKIWLDKVLTKRRKKEKLDKFEAIEPFLLEKLGKTEEAQQRLTQLIKKAENDHIYWTSLGEAAMFLFGDKERGVAFFEKQLAYREPNSPLILYYVANYYAEKGEPQKALQYIVEYKPYIGSNRRLQQLERQLQQQLATSFTNEQKQQP